MAAAIKDTPQFEDRRLAQENQRYRQIVWGALGVIVFLVLVVTMLALRPTPPPYVLALKNGEIVQRAIPINGPESLPDAAIDRALQIYITDLFRVSRDGNEEHALITEAQQMSQGQATQRMSTYFNQGDKDNNPFQAAKDGYWQSVNHIRVLKQPTPNLYEVDFQTLRYAANVNEPIIKNYHATAHLILGQPDAQRTWGIVVDNFDFTEDVK